MAIAESILFQINSSNYTAPIATIYKPATGFSGFITTLRLTVNIKSIDAAEFPYIPDDTPPDVLQQILDDVATNTQFREIILYQKKGTGDWIERAPIRLFNKEPYYDVNLMRFFSDSNTIDVAEDLSLGIQVKLGNALTSVDTILVWGSVVAEKKNNGNEELSDRIAALETLLSVYGAPSASLPGTNGLVPAPPAGSSEFLLRGDRSWENPTKFATPAQITTAINTLVGNSSTALDTLTELGAALANDANFAATIATQLALKAPIASPSFTGPVTTAGQIIFPSVQNPSSNPNILDDYLEGTFIPTVIGTTTDGLGTYTTRAGSFTKIGKRIFFDLFVEWTDHTGTGTIRIAGLPYISTVSSCTTIWHRNLTLVANSVLMANLLTINNAAIINIASIPAGGGGQSNVAMDTAAGIMLGGTYITTN
ncbi:hypothetical protein QUB37_03920 [Microcoleus sp. AT3-A2]|uniref:hypothetical protein n=1 Tax=Microcoleus sp. AT3-A2 TaxID=2818610 RepID=UPI002FD6BD57